MVEGAEDRVRPAGKRATDEPVQVLLVRVGEETPPPKRDPGLRGGTATTTGTRDSSDRTQCKACDSHARGPARRAERLGQKSSGRLLTTPLYPPPPYYYAS